MNTIYINTDGGARGNPGPAGIGIIFYDKDGNELHSHKEYIGEATNNQAEYRAIIRALEILNKCKWLKEHKGDPNSKAICRLDSQLVVEQICGNYKVKNSGISELMIQVKSLINKINVPIQFLHITREKNKKADKLVNYAIDSR